MGSSEIPSTTAKTAPQPATAPRRASAPPPSPPLPIDGPNIKNIVCGVNLNCRIDLKTVALHARNATYAPKRFQACILRQRDPKSSALVFASGKMQVLGTKSVSDAHLAARKFARTVQKVGFNVRLSEFNVQNIVAHANAKCAVRSEGIAQKHWRFAQFEPEIFPVMVYRLLEPKVTALIFANGKMMILGAKTEEDIKAAARLMYLVIKEYPVHNGRADDARQIGQ